MKPINTVLGILVTSIVAIAILWSEDPLKGHPGRLFSLLGIVWTLCVLTLRQWDLLGLPPEDRTSGSFHLRQIGACVGFGLCLVSAHAMAQAVPSTGFEATLVRVLLSSGGVAAFALVAFETVIDVMRRKRATSDIRHAQVHESATRN